MIFGEFAPDKAKSGNPEILTECEGVYPMEDGYRPVGQFVSAYSALAAAPKGGAAFTSPLGTSYIVAGTSTSLYKAFGSGWTELASGFNVQGENRWRFAQFGGLAIATNGADDLRKIDLATGAVSLLGGSPPKFETLAVVKDFLVGGVRNGNIMHLGWSGINDAEWWTVGQRQADLNILPTGGRINGILSGEYGVILQRDRIVRMDYVGGNIVFEFNEISSSIGCVTVHSVAQWGRLGFFYSDEGFMMWDGQSPVPIGREKVNRDFAGRYDANDWAQMSTAIDPVNAVVMWAMPDRIYLYSWLFQQWAIVPFVAPIIFSGVTKGIGLEEYSAQYPDLDNARNPVLDDLTFRGGDPKLYVFNSSYALGAFEGTPMAAKFTGTDLELFSGQRACLRMARPDTDATSNLTLTLLGKQRLGDAGSSTAFTSLTTSGDMPLRFSARFIRPTFQIAAGTTWSYAKGVNYVGEPGSGR